MEMSKLNERERERQTDRERQRERDREREREIMNFSGKWMKLEKTILS